MINCTFLGELSFLLLFANRFTGRYQKDPLPYDLRAGEMTQLVRRSSYRYIFNRILLFNVDIQ